MLRSGRIRRWSLVSLLVVVSAACVPRLDAPGATGRIELISSATLQGFHIDYYRNTAYPCSISGYQTFALAYRDGTGTSVPAPLWVYTHGGGAGYFDAARVPQPDDTNMREEAMPTLLQAGLQPGLFPLVRADSLAFRFLAVSYCDRDLYGGVNRLDPNNPNKQPDGAAITTNGLLATKAAIQFASAKVATTKFILHGGSAGSVGSYSVAWSLQMQGLAPAAVIADSGVTNQEWLQAVVAQGVSCPGRNPATDNPAALAARMHPDLAKIENEPDKLVSRGALTVPIMHIWNRGDPMGCGPVPLVCPLRDGTSVTLGGTDCMNEPLRRAIVAEGPSSRSRNLAVCVADPTSPDPANPCNRHVVTLVAGTNTEPGTPADYNATIMEWVHQRLLD